MKLRTLVLAMSTAAGLSLAPAAFAQTCSTGQWGQGGNPTVTATVGAPIASGPTTGLSRYQGRCALSSGTAVAGGRYVQDSSPNSEATFRARFYVFTAATGGNATVFRAGNVADPLTGSMGSGRIRVVYNGSNQLVVSGPAASLPAFTVAPNRWYSVEIAYNNTATALGTGPDTLAASSIRATVGSRSATNIWEDTVTSQTGALPAVAASNNIDYVQLGQLDNTAGGGRTLVDSYESRRTTRIGRVCRGDSNGSGGDITVADRGILTAEIADASVAANLAPGIPDCNEDGDVTVADRGCVTQLIANAVSCP